MKSMGKLRLEFEIELPSLDGLSSKKELRSLERDIQARAKDRAIQAHDYFLLGYLRNNSFTVKASVEKSPDLPSIKLDADERKVLAFLVEHHTHHDRHYFTFQPIMDDTGLDRKHARRACRSLRRKGLTEFRSGLWDDEGVPAGAGYAATAAGVEFIKEFIKSGGR